MNKFGKSIKIFLIDGDPSGRMTCELSNWTGKAYKIPKIEIKKCWDRVDLKKTGVYLLFGKSENGSDLVYIGESENIYNRLCQHITAKDFWNESIIFISKDENLNKAHIKFLENRLYEIANDIGIYEIENTTIPSKASISESDRSEMENFITNISMLTNRLGHKLFEKNNKINNTVVSVTNDINSKSIFKIKNSNDVDAKGKLAPTLEIPNGFLVFKDTCLSSNVMPSMSPGNLKKRGELIKNSVIISKNNKLILDKDYIFNSSSAAASVIMGGSFSGPSSWKNCDGVALKDF